MHRPDGLWALLVLNKDPKRTWKLDVGFSNGRHLSGQVSLIQFGPAQYAWRAHGDTGETARSEPPAVRAPSDVTSIDAPPDSISVVLGQA